MKYFGVVQVAEFIMVIIIGIEIFQNLHLFICLLNFQNGFLSAIPYVTMWISAMICGIISDWLIKKCALDVTLVRKIFISIGY